MILLAIWAVLLLAGPRPATQTPIDPADLASELRSAYVEVYGSEPKPARLAMAWAHVSLECGRGSKARQFNIGNIGRRKTRPYYRYAGSDFEAFTSTHAGAVRYWEVMRSRTRALACFDAGDGDCAAEALSGNYHRAPVDTYGAGLRGLFGEGIRLTQ